jgi:micrococcal nuclease
MIKRVLIFLIIIIFLGALSVFYPYLTGEKSIKGVEYERETIFVERVIDGDTLVDQTGVVYRLLGINTPEKGEEYYQEAKDYLSVVNEKQIEVLRDWDDKGKYGRDLRYIFYEGRLINVELVEQGLASAYYYEDLVYEGKLLTAEKIARENCLMLWEKDCN